MLTSTQSSLERSTSGDNKESIKIQLTKELLQDYSTRRECCSRSEELSESRTASFVSQQRPGRNRESWSSEQLYYRQDSMRLDTSPRSSTRRESSRHKSCARYNSPSVKASNR